MVQWVKKATSFIDDLKLTSALKMVTPTLQGCIPRDSHYHQGYQSQSLDPASPKEPGADSILKKTIKHTSHSEKKRERDNTMWPHWGKEQEEPVSLKSMFRA